jgi:hypothetical protein
MSLPVKAAPVLAVWLPLLAEELTDIQGLFVEIFGLGDDPVYEPDHKNSGYKVIH